MKVKEDFYDKMAMKWNFEPDNYPYPEGSNQAEMQINETENTIVRRPMPRNVSGYDLKNPDAINPQHYKDIVPGYQYMEMMVHMLRNLGGVESHLLGQVYKYLMRCGKKDDEVQELNKAKWYLDALIKYKTEGKVV